MLKIESVTTRTPQLSEIRSLYRRAFPANERSPFRALLQDPMGCGDFMAFFDGDTFCGFAVLLTHGDITHILYIAIEETLRDSGYGAQALRAIQDRHPGNRILADIEAPRPEANNNAQRRKRKQFYLRNGYTVSPIRYNWQGEAYEILVSNGTLTCEEFWAFWDFFGEEKPE